MSSNARAIAIWLLRCVSNDYTICLREPNMFIISIINRLYSQCLLAVENIRRMSCNEGWTLAFIVGYCVRI